jgi:tetratricopeptide (TPR) repeat protein
LKQRHWFNFVEDFSLLGLGAGLSLSFISKQILYTSAPLSFALLIAIINRRRIEQAQDQKLSDSVANLDKRISENVSGLDQKIQNMPTPEMIGEVRQSVLKNCRSRIEQTNAEIEKVKHEVHRRLSELDQLKLREAREEITQLQLQYVEVYNSLNGIAASLPSLATNERAKELEQAIADVSADTSKVDAAVKSLNEFSNHTLTNLQDQVTQLNRQIKALPPQADTSSIRREVSELVRVVADMVPKRDLNAMVADLRVVQQQQTNQLQTEETLRRDLQKVNKRLQSLPDVPQLRSQLEESFTREIRAINRQLRTLYHSPELKSTIEGVLRGELQQLRDMIAEQAPALPYDLVFDLASDPNSTADPIIPSSRKALMEALESTQERLILIWPWSAHTELDSEMLRQIEGYLKQQRQLDIGWCHGSDRHDHRFLNIINRRWSITPFANGSLQGTLKRLLAIKHYYPSHFHFKILGAAENYLISDESFAILGLDARLKTQTSLKEAELKLKTTDDQIIRHLIQRFDEANPPAHDIDAYWNRAVTRYDLGDKDGAIADLEAILLANPEEAAAYNLRGIIRYEQKNRAAALDDFSQSITLDPAQCSAYCNRGYLHSEQGDQYGAIADFSLAIDADPSSAIAYFYRGAASQKLEDYDGAIADYSEALTHAPDAPVIFYQRAMVYQAIRSYTRAIADLERAAHFFEEQNSPVNAQKAQETLLRVKQLQREAPSVEPELESPASSSAATAKDDSLDSSSDSAAEVGRSQESPVDSVESSADLMASVELEESVESLESVESVESATHVESVAGFSFEGDTHVDEAVSDVENSDVENKVSEAIGRTGEPEDVAEGADIDSMNPVDGTEADAIETPDNFSVGEEAQDADEPSMGAETPRETPVPTEFVNDLASFGVEESVQFSGALEEPFSDEKSAQSDAFVYVDENQSDVASIEYESVDELFEEDTVDSPGALETVEIEPDALEAVELELDTVESNIMDSDADLDLEALSLEESQAGISTLSSAEQFSESGLFDDFEPVTNVSRDVPESNFNLADHSVDSIIWDRDDTTEPEASIDQWFGEEGDAGQATDDSPTNESATDEFAANDFATNDAQVSQEPVIDPERTYVQADAQEQRWDTAPSLAEATDTSIEPESTDAQAIEVSFSANDEGDSSVADHSVDSIVWDANDAWNPTNREGGADEAIGAGDAAKNESIDNLFGALGDDELASSVPFEPSSPLPQSSTEVASDETTPEPGSMDPGVLNTSVETVDQLFDTWGEDSTPTQFPSNEDDQPITFNATSDTATADTDQEQQAAEPLAFPSDDVDEADQRNSERWGDFFGSFGVEETSSSNRAAEENDIEDVIDSPEQDEVDTQQIGAQTLQDFFSVINSEGNSGGGDLFSAHDAWDVPESNGYLTQSNPNRTEPPRSYAANGDRPTQDSDQPSNVDNHQFLRFSDPAPLVPSAQPQQDSQVTDNPYSRNVSEQSSDDDAQSIDEDSLADFCNRFT